MINTLIPACSIERRLDLALNVSKVSRLHAAELFCTLMLSRSGTQMVSNLRVTVRPSKMTDATICSALQVLINMTHPMVEKPFAWTFREGLCSSVQG
tara:strand:- start:924 stop:1214 length:291 start_codon:yes stop_codon:yes gene_type:complete